MADTAHPPASGSTARTGDDSGAAGAAVREPPPYVLGVDLGTSFTAAAVLCEGAVEVVSLGTRSLEVPSVVHLHRDGRVTVGEAAESKGAADPTRVAREFKRRLGDPVPILVGGSPFSAARLMAELLSWVTAEVTERRGRPPSQVVLTRPANWGPYKSELFATVAELAGISGAVTVTEPEAAAAHFASTGGIAIGRAVAVYDLGGGTFDAAVLRRGPAGFDTLGTPQGLEHLGGVDLDEAVLRTVRDALGAGLEGLDPGDPTVRQAIWRLRQQCIEAKEELSRDTETTLVVLLPGLHTEIRLTRAEFEEIAGPALRTTLDCLMRTIDTAAVGPSGLDAVVLTGGSSRIPMVAELVGTHLGLPVARGTHPKHSVALGAALLGGPSTATADAVSTVDLEPVAPSTRTSGSAAGTGARRMRVRAAAAGLAATIAAVLALAFAVAPPREGGTPQVAVQVSQAADDDAMGAASAAGGRPGPDASGPTAAKNRTAGGSQATGRVRTSTGASKAAKPLKVSATGTARTADEHGAKGPAPTTKSAGSTGASHAQRPAGDAAVGTAGVDGTAATGGPTADQVSAADPNRSTGAAVASSPVARWTGWPSSARHPTTPQADDRGSAGGTSADTASAGDGADSGAGAVGSPQRRSAGHAPAGGTSEPPVTRPPAERTSAAPPSAPSSAAITPLTTSPAAPPTTSDPPTTPPPSSAPRPPTTYRSTPRVIDPCGGFIQPLRGRPKCDP